ncbi:MAG: PQQ-dependent sugar dehydrogenase [Candidatus Saccharimonadaceae bacterium]
MYTLRQIPCIITILVVAFNAASCQQVQSTGTLIPFATGISNPVCIANAGDSRLFVVDQRGYIRIIDSDGNVSPQPFLDIRSQVTFGGEQGLLGLAFHPQYESNGYFYVNYIGAGDSTHISRFSVNPGDPATADPASEFNLMTIYQPFTNHNGGDLQFGPDGYLYIGMGDGGSAGDPDNRAQNLMQYLGKMLRIDVNLGNPFAIPDSNPFNGSMSAMNEIWALGLRNPWKFSFDRLTGDLWIGDVGQNSFEEINMQSAASTGGENYGWRCYEGNQSYNSNGCGPEATFNFPVYTYPHGGECSVTGGYVYRGSPSSPYYGHYFFADYCSDRIWTLHNVSGNWVKEDFGQFAGNNFSSFGEDASGHLYVAGLTSGTIYRVGDNSIGITENTKPPDIKIIQDPFSDKVLIETGRTNLPIISLELNDVKGSTLLKKAIKEQTYELDTSFLPAGIYFLKVGIEGKSVVQKLVKGK